MLVRSVVLLTAFLVRSEVKVVLHNCDPAQPETCGPAPAKCLVLPTGNRCRCGHGRMGMKCQRPCQDVYRSCKRWKEEGRCVWSRTILPFFEDNCARSCGICENDGTVLAKALPVGLEPLAWLVGRWETKVSNNLKFPTAMADPKGYHEILEIQLNEVNMFDRPTLNYSVRARSQNGMEEHNELGFITLKLAKEDTGFVRSQADITAKDEVAIEQTSNTGISTIEEGTLGQRELSLRVTHKALLDHLDQRFISAKRRFLQRSPMTLDEVVSLIDGNGRPQNFVKRFRRTFDYLGTFVKEVDNDLGLTDD